MDEKYKLITSSLGEERVKLDQQLSEYSHSKIDLLAKFFYISTNQRELIKVLDLCEELKIPFLILGSGTKFVYPNKNFNGLVIKNRTSNIKIAGIKGKISKDGLGINEALVEVDSGVSMLKLNEFLESQHFSNIVASNSTHSTIGGSIFLDPELSARVKELKVWNGGVVENIEIKDLNREYMVISVIFQFKTKDSQK